MLVDNIMLIRDEIKERFSTHTIDSVNIHSQDDELTHEQLERVCGGMSTEQFDYWRARELNKRR
jgi:hypothetical protein